MIVESLKRVEISSGFLLFRIFESELNSRKNGYKFTKFLIGIDPNFSFKESINHKLSACEISLDQHDKNFNHENIVVFLQTIHN